MNQYHIFEAIGHGKQSTVYKGRKKKTIEYYAIKSVDKSQKSKVLQEVRILHTLDHLNVLKFYAWYETNQHLWLVLEYCVGGDLMALLRQDKRLPEESIHDFARDLVLALQFLHSKGIIYCDLKPSNILLDENGRLKLCDFGLARRLSDISKHTVSQLPQAKRGTPCYMAPELFQEGGVHSFASDLWALGCVLYECFSGRPPFVGKEFTKLLKSIISDPTPPLRDGASKEFSDLVNRLLVKDPAERIQWPELCTHAFWKSAIETMPLPAQPAFNNLIQLSSKSAIHEKDHIPKNAKYGLQGSHNKNTGESHQAKGPLTPAKGISNSENTQNQRKKPVYPIAEERPLKENAGINLLRLSKIVKTNLQKETEGENYRKASSKHSGDDDVKIENHDQELDFAENVDNEHSEENDPSEAAVPETPTCDGKTLENAPSSKEKDDDDSNCVSLDTRIDGSGIGSDDTKHVVETTRLDQEVAATPPFVGPQRRVNRPLGITSDTGKVPAASPADTDPSKVSMHIAQALWHPSDLSVKPIMLSRKVDKAGDQVFDPRALPFDILSPTDFVKLSSESDQFDSYMGRILTSINGNSVTEKLNTLRYIETLSSNVESSNLLTNGPVMPLLVKMFRISKTPAFRIQLMYVIGLLIRHATLIEDEVASSGIVSALTDGLRDKQERVRRFSMAALGELLFYISTQSEHAPRTAGGQENPTKDGRPSTPWQVPSTIIGLVCSTLRKGEDDATQLYALKTIENIASQGGEWAARFTNNEVICNLCYIFKAPGKHENLRLTAGSCLVRLLRFSPPNIHVVQDKLIFKEFVSGLSKGNPKEQQININLLNMTLFGSNMNTNMSRQLLTLVEDRNLVQSLVSLLEQATEVLRGKAFICMALLCKTNRKWLLSICNAKVLPALERLTKEKDAYVQQCIEAFVQTVASLVPSILETISSDTHNISNNKRSGLIGTPQAGRTQSRSIIHLFPVIFHLFNSPVFKHRIASSQVLAQLANCMKYLEVSSFQGRDDFQSTLLRILEIVAQESSILLSNADIFIAKVLPSLAILYKNNADGDSRFLCLKILFDVMLVFLNDMSDYHLSLNSTRAKDLKSISETYFLPLYTTFLEDEDPIPMYAQKLLVMLLDLRCIRIGDILQLKLVAQFFEFLSDDLSNANVNNVRLCLLLSTSEEVETQILSELKIVRRIGALLEFVSVREMEDFLEPTLLLCRSFLLRSIEKEKLLQLLELLGDETLKLIETSNKKSSISDISDFGSYINVFLQLSGYHEAKIAKLASECLVLLANESKSSLINLLTNVSSMVDVFELLFNRHNQSSSFKLQLCLLYVLDIGCKEYHSRGANHPLWISKSEMAKLLGAMSKMRNSSNTHLAELASNVALELQSLPHGT